MPTIAGCNYSYGTPSADARIGDLRICRQDTRDAGFADCGPCTVAVLLEVTTCFAFNMNNAPGSRGSTPLQRRQWLISDIRDRGNMPTTGSTGEGQNKTAFQSYVADGTFTSLNVRPPSTLSFTKAPVNFNTVLKPDLETPGRWAWVGVWYRAMTDAFAPRRFGTCGPDANFHHAIAIGEYDSTADTCTVVESLCGGGWSTGCADQRGDGPVRNVPMSVIRTAAGQYYGSSAGNVRGFSAQYGGQLTETSLSTTLAAAASIGATNIKVTSVDGVAIGDWVRINVAGVLEEFRQIISPIGTPGPTGTGLSFTTPLTKAHSSGVVVVETSEPPDPDPSGSYVPWDPCLEQA
jgi:hypothetical protein